MPAHPADEQRGNLQARGIQMGEVDGVPSRWANRDGVISPSLLPQPHHRAPEGSWGFSGHYGVSARLAPN